MSHSRFEEALVSFVMDGSISQQDRDELLPHIASCDPCRDLYKDLEGTASDLAFAAPVALPPRDLEDRIVDRIRRGRGEDATTRKDRRSWMMSAAAAVVLVVMGAVGGILWSSATGNDREAQQMIAAMRTLQDPAAAVARLAGQDNAVGIVAVRPDGTGYLVITGLSSAPSGHLHELWLIRDGEPMPARVFNVAAGTNSMVIDLSDLPENFDAAAITIERAPHGSPKPTTDVILSGPRIRV